MRPAQPHVFPAILLAGSRVSGSARITGKITTLSPFHPPATSAPVGCRRSKTSPEKRPNRSLSFPGCFPSEMLLKARGKAAGASPGLTLMCQLPATGGICQLWPRRRFEKRLSALGVLLPQKTPAACFESGLRGSSPRTAPASCEINAAGERKV